MARSADVVKWRLWQQRLQRFERGSLTVAAFCQAESVSPASFYHWRRMLRHGATQSRETAFDRPMSIGGPAFVPVKVVATATVEVHLPNGVRLEVPAADRAALEAVVATVSRLPGTAGEEVDAC
jgi:transposase-like protein